MSGKLACHIKDLRDVLGEDLYMPWTPPTIYICENPLPNPGTKLYANILQAYL